VDMNPREPHLLGHKPGTGPFTVYGTEIGSRLLLGTALYPSPQIMADAVRASGAGIVAGQANDFSISSARCL
jgi:thiazole synthase